MSATNFDKKDIRIVGFDLDQTLYPKSPEIDAAIQEYIYVKIARHRHCSREKAKKLFTDLYQDGKGLTGSQTLQKLGVPHPKEVVQEALERADISKFIVPNPKTKDLLHKIRQKFRGLDLITGSPNSIALKKLELLAIERETFHFVIPGEFPKGDGSAFRLWLETYPDAQPSQFLYIGDREKTDHIIPQEFGIRTALVNITKPNPALNCLQLSTLHELEKHLL